MTKEFDVHEFILEVAKNSCSKRYSKVTRCVHSTRNKKDCDVELINALEEAISYVRDSIKSIDHVVELCGDAPNHLYVSKVLDPIRAVKEESVKQAVQVLKVLREEHWTKTLNDRRCDYNLGA